MLSFAPLSIASDSAIAATCTAAWSTVGVLAIAAAASVPMAMLLTRLVPKSFWGPASRAPVDLDESLRQGQEQMRLLVESVRDYAIFMLDREGRVVTWNAGAERLKGYSADEIIGKHVSVFYAPEDDPEEKSRRSLERAEREGRADDEGWRIRKDGSRFWAHVVISAVRDAGGALVGYAKVTRDSTEAKCAVDEQRNSEAKFRALLESAPDAMVIVDDSGRIALVNAQTEKLFGYTSAELLQQPAEILIPKRSRGRYVERRAGYFSDPPPPRLRRFEELYGIHKDGSEFPIEVSLAPLRAQDGVLVSAAIRDITARKEAEAALRVANRELEAFNYSVAHDLRAPLRGVTGFARLLLEDYHDKLGEEANHWLQQITTNAMKMGELIDALLSLSQVSRAELKPERIDLASLARAAVAHLASLEPERSVELSAENPLSVDMDPSLARSLVDNLIGNAWKFTGKTHGARIDIGRAETNGDNVFFVRDNGAGFDMGGAKKLFNPFQRLHAQRDFPGTGIGLATVQRIVHRHGGRVWAEGSVNQGATIYFTLPLRASMLPPPDLQLSS